MGESKDLRRDRARDTGTVRIAARQFCAGEPNMGVRFARRSSTRTKEGTPAWQHESASIEVDRRASAGFSSA